MRLGLTCHSTCGPGRLPRLGAIRKSGPGFSQELVPMISLAELQSRIDSGDLSPEAAVARSCKAMDAHEKTIGAFVCRASNIGASDKGPLRGIAVGIKDIIDTADLPTEM